MDPSCRRNHYVDSSLRRVFSENQKMSRKWVHKRRIWTIIRPKRSKRRRGPENRGLRALGELEKLVFGENGILRNVIWGQSFAPKTRVRPNVIPMTALIGPNLVRGSYEPNPRRNRQHRDRNRTEPNRGRAEIRDGHGRRKYGKTRVQNGSRVGEIEK